MLNPHNADEHLPRSLHHKQLHTFTAGEALIGRVAPLAELFESIDGFFHPPGRQVRCSRGLTRMSLAFLLIASVSGCRDGPVQKPVHNLVQPAAAARAARFLTLILPSSNCQFRPS